MKKFIKQYGYLFPLWTIFAVVIALVIQNVHAGSYMAGWDNLMTEFYPTLGIKRAFFSVWQEYQSFGLLAGMSHAADLFRSLYIFILSIFLPQWTIRIVVLTSCLLMGTTGAFYLAKRRMEQRYALVSAFFYLLSFGTVQIMFIPYEPFSLFFAYLPWQIVSLLWIFDTKQPTRKHLIFFALIHLLASSYAYVQTLFLVYLSMVVPMSLVMLIKHRNINILKTLTILALVMFVVNAYWLLPQVYFVATSRPVVQNAKSNQLSTDTTVLQNKEKGTLKEFIVGQGYYYDLYNTSNQQLFSKWKEHFASNEFIRKLPYLMFFIICVGLVSHAHKNSEFIPLILLTAVALLGNTPFFGDINQFLRMDSVINQLFRSPFTKFVIPHTLLSGYFLGLGIMTLSRLTRRDKIISFGVVVIMFVLIFYSSLPSFKGYYFSPNMRGPIPHSYLQAMQYFKNQDTDKRIALLPDYTYWGWFKYRWGYDGSGFLWYGIEQPIISRTFDVWSRESENYYWEIKQAIESEDPNLFRNVANKYNVSYFLLDTSLLPVTSSAKGMQYERLNHLIPQVSSMQKIAQWDNLTLYENTDQKDVQNFVQVASDLPVIGPQIQQTNYDMAYTDSLGYATENQPFQNVAVYPFANLTSQTRTNTPDWKLSENAREFVAEYTHPVDLNTYDVTIPVDRFSQVLYTDEGVATKSGYIYSIQNTDGHLTVHFPKLLIRQFEVTDTEVENCGNTKGELEVGRSSGVRVATDNQASACFGYSDSTLDQNYSYLVSLDSERMQGRSFLFYTLDLTKKESVIEDRLKGGKEYFIIPSRYRYGLGYNFSFQQNSYTGIPSENRLTKMSVYAFPYNELKQIQFVRKNAPENVYKAFIGSTTNKIAYYLYSVHIDPTSYKSPYVMLYQSYHDGWKAYRVTGKGWIDMHFPFLRGTEIKSHVSINNWANGWKLPADFQPDLEYVVLFFWPQYLQYFGLLLLVGALFILIPWKWKKRTSH